MYYKHPFHFIGPQSSMWPLSRCASVIGRRPRVMTCSVLYYVTIQALLRVQLSFGETALARMLHCEKCFRGTQSWRRNRVFSHGVKAGLDD